MKELKIIHALVIEGRMLSGINRNPEEITEYLDQLEYIIALYLNGNSDSFNDYIDHIIETFGINDVRKRIK